MSPDGSENQHTVQKALLRGFADENGYLQVRSRDGTDRRVASKHTTVEANFYSFRDADGSLNHYFDNQMKRLESRLPALRQELQATGTLGRRSKREFDRYVAYALTRTRTVRHIIDQVDIQSRPLATRIETARVLNIDLDRLTPGSVNALDSFGRWMGTLATPGAPDPQLSKLRTIVRTAATFQHRMRPLEWRTVTFREPILLTSDVGLAPLRISGTYRGLLEQGEPVVVPLGPTSLAIGARTRRHAEFDNQEAVAEASNQALCTAAYDEAYRHPDMAWPDGLTLSPDRVTVTHSPTARRGTTARPEDPGRELSEADSRRGLDPLARAILTELNRERPAPTDRR